MVVWCENQSGISNCSISPNGEKVYCHGFCKRKGKVKLKCLE